MDDWREVKGIEAEVHSDERRVETARERLMAAVASVPEGADARVDDGAQRRARRRRWRVGIGAGLLVGAAAAVTAVVVVSNLAPARPVAPLAQHTSSPRPSAVPVPPSPVPTPTVAPESPASVLMSAAEAASHGYLTPGPGQYVKVTMFSEYIELSDGYLIDGPQRGIAYEEATRAWLISRERTEYVPYDVTEDWVGVSSPMRVVRTFGEENPVMDERQSVSIDQWNERWATERKRQLYPSGGWLPEGDSTFVGDMLLQMPNDPEGIRAWHRQQLGDSMSDYRFNVVLGWRLIRLLAYNAGPPAVRAGMLQLLSQLPGASIIGSQGNQRTIAFDSTYGEEYDASAVHQRHTVTVDTVTGVVTGLSVSTNPGAGIVPGDVPDARTTYTVSIVDAIPEG